ncbi:MAG: galactokinase [Armatimonadota bacterium]
MPINSRTLHHKVIEEFKRIYTDAPDIGLVRAPGRVNIIGEHLDYNGLHVFPIAAERNIAIAFSPAGGPEVCLSNIDPAFGERQFTTSGDIEHYAAGDWGNYAKASVQALWGWAKEHQSEALPLKGFKGIAGGNIPKGSGLSSSSAMVVAVALVMVKVNALNISPIDLADLLAHGERYVGTEGGGMDHAASILSKAAGALKIDFNPLRAKPVPMLDDAVFVVANSLVRAEKAGSARLAFNTRVVECRLGVQVLKALARERYPQVESAVVLGDVMRSVPEWRSLLNIIPEGLLNLEQISDISGVSVKTLADNCLKLRNGSMLDESVRAFDVKKRVCHVLTEAERVELAAKAALDGDLVKLGELMNQSHTSCAEDYGVSCPELDVLVETLRRHGALGARLTGAGFGGCTVALVQRNTCNAVIDAVWADYYQGYALRAGLDAAAGRDDIIFGCRPSAGAQILDVSEVASLRTGV